MYRKIHWVAMIVLVGILSPACQKGISLPPVPVEPQVTPAASVTPTSTLPPGLPALSFDCTSDTYSAPATGSISIGYSQDVIALCDGWVIVGDRALNQVKILNIFTGALDRWIQLSAAPGELELDASNRFLYVVLESANSLARVNLNNNQVTLIPLSAPAFHIATGNEGRVFACLDESATWPDVPLAIIDGPAGVAVTTILTGYYSGLPGDSGYLAYDQVHDQLFLGVRGMSPSSLYRYTYNPATDALSCPQTLWDAGSNGQDLAVSPDGNHLGFACGSGNGTPTYTIYDFSTMDLLTTFGSWNTGSYPSAVDFSRDSTLAVASDGEEIIVYSVATHAQLKISGFGYSAYRFFRCRFSGGQRWALGLHYEIYSGDDCRIVWMAYP